jgi:hypothetical protein
VRGSLGVQPGGLRRRRRGWRATDSDSQAGTDSDSDSDSDANTDSNADANSHTDAHSNADANSHTDAEPLVGIQYDRI